MYKSIICIILVLVCIGTIYILYKNKKISINLNTKLDEKIEKKNNNVNQFNFEDIQVSDDSLSLINKIINQSKYDIVPINKICLKIKINNYIDNINIDLYDDIVPRTVKNFVELSLNYYKNSIFYKLIKDILIQGGDFINNDGTGKYSIYGQTFEEENFILKHSKNYLVSMISNGVNSINCNFCITLIPLPNLDNKNVVFGIILDRNSQNFINKLNLIEVDNNNKPLQDIQIIDTIII